MKYLMACLLGLFSTASVYAQTDPIPVKVVVVTMFEIGTDDDEIAGEFQLWKERRNLTETFAFGGSHDLHFDPESGVLAMVTGIGTARSAASIAMLGMDPRFDLSKAYWLVAGIAGIDPEDASIGSAAWATLSAAENLLKENDGYAGLEASIESAYIVGSKVVDALLEGWDVFESRLPTTADLK